MDHTTGTTEQPLVSVLMTAYNRAPYIGGAIESVLNSTYQHWELIILDDCSSDNTVEVARSYEAKDKRIRVLINDNNLTDYPNRQKIASYAKGKYLKYVDSDDMLYPYGLEIMVKRMEEHPEAAIGFAKLPDYYRPYPFTLTPHEAYTRSFLMGKEVFSNAPTSVIIRRDVFEKTGGFSGLNQYGDYEFFLKVGAQYPSLLLEGAVTWDRCLPGSEKDKDSQTTKLVLARKLVLHALNAPINPLTSEETKQAIRRFNRIYNRATMRAMADFRWKDAVKLLKGRKG